MTVKVNKRMLMKMVDAAMFGRLSVGMKNLNGESSLRYGRTHLLKNLKRDHGGVLV